MPDCASGDFVVASPSSCSHQTPCSATEQVLRKSFSDMLGNAGMDSFMNSVGNFMTDEEFFKMEDFDVFREMYEEYQNTPAKLKKQSAAKLLDSFSDLMAQKRKFSPKDLSSLPKGDKRLEKMRTELNLDEVDDEESKVASKMSPGSIAQDSTISYVSAYQRGIKLANLGANPLGVSVSSEAFFAVDEEDARTESGEESTVFSQSEASRKGDDNNFRQRRAMALNESRNKLSYIPETPRSRVRRNQTLGDANDSTRISVRSSKITMTPMKESGQRPRSRGRARTPNRNRDASRSPGRSPLSFKGQFSSGPKGDSVHSRGARFVTPERQRGTPKSFESIERTPTKSPLRATHSRSPGGRLQSSHGEARRRTHSRSPTTPSRSTRQQQGETQTRSSPRKMSYYASLKKQDGKTSLSLNKLKNQAATSEATDTDEPSEMTSVAEKSLSTEQQKNRNNWENVTDSTVIPPREKVATKLQIRKRLHDSDRARSAGRGYRDCAEEPGRRSRSRSVSRRNNSNDSLVRKGETFPVNAARSRNRGSRSSSGRDDDVSVDTSVEESILSASVDARTNSPSRSTRGGRRLPPTENINRVDYATKKNAFSEARGPCRRISDSGLEALRQSTNNTTLSPDDSSAKSPGRSSRNGARRSFSSDDILPLNNRTRVRRCGSRHSSSGSRHSIDSHDSVSAMSTSESIVSATDNSSVSTSDVRGRSSRGRARPVSRGRARRDGDGHHRARSTGPPARRSRSASGRSPAHLRHEDLVCPRTTRVVTPGNVRGSKTPTRSRREPLTPTRSRVPMSRTEELASMRVRKLTPSTPQPTSKPSLGMARVKDLNSRKSRSSSAPRQGRRTAEREEQSLERLHTKSCDKPGNQHASFSGRLEGLKSFQHRNYGGAEDDLNSVDQSVQTWDPSSVRKPRTRRQGPTRARLTSSVPGIDDPETVPGRRRHVERRKAPQ